MFKSFFNFVERFVPIPYEPRTSFSGADALLALLMGFLAIAISIYGSNFFDPAIYEMRGFNIWFQADPPRVISAMNDPASTWHYRTSVHPLFSLLSTPLTGLLTANGFDVLQVGRGIMAACGFLAAGSLLLALRGLGLPRAAATLFTGVFLASATYIHWFSLTETYAPAAVSTAIVLLVLTSVGADRWFVWLVASVGALAVTVTNWAVALTSTVCRLGLKKAISLNIAALLVVVALATAQKALYPNTKLFFLPGELIDELRYTQIYSEVKRTGSWTPFSNIWSVAVTSAVTPAPQEVNQVDNSGKPVARIVSNQSSPLGSHGVIGWIALGSWLLVLAAGTLGGLANVERRAVFSAISLFLLSQSALHAVYGEITFLYAANFFPALVLFAAFSWFSRLRSPAVIAAIAFVVCGGVSNFMQFKAAVQIANTLVLGR